MPPKPPGKVVRFPRVAIPGSLRLSVNLILVVLLGLYFASGLYTVGPDELGVVRRFGKHVASTGPGFHYRLPYPIETVVTPKVTEVKRVEIGFRTVSSGSPAKYANQPEESTMLTGDENIVNAEMIVQYRIADAPKALFKISDPELIIRDAAEAALRQVVGSRTIDEVLTEGKQQIQDETKKLVQRILDSYESGLLAVAVQLQDVHPPEAVQDAFKDVASAKEDKSKLINEAQGYRNDIIPKARGEAEKMLRDSEAFKAERVTKAEGDAAKFGSILAEYQKGKNVTRTRMYLEAMEEILPNVELYIIDDKSSSGIIPYLPLNSLKEGGAAR